MSVSIIELQPILLELDFWPKRPSHKDGTLLECYSDQNEWQHYPLPSEGP